MTTETIAKRILMKLQSTKMLPDTYLVPPQMVERCCATIPETGEPLEFPIETHEWKAVDGDWDIGGREFRSLEVYQAMRMRMDGVPWESTPFYPFVLRHIAAGGYYYATDKAGLDRRCVKWDQLMDDMRKHGYKPKGTKDEICVNIARNGSLLHNNGRHRLAAAQLIGVPLVAVRVSAYHPKWHGSMASIVDWWLMRHPCGTGG